MNPLLHHNLLRVISVQFVDDLVDVVGGFAIEVNLIKPEGDLVTQYAVLIVGMN